MGDGFFGLGFLSGDSSFDKWKKENSPSLADKYGVGAGSEQANMLAEQDFGVEGPEQTSPDWKGMAKGLGEGLTAYNKAQAPIKAQGLYQQAQAPQPMPMGVAANQTMGQPQGVSGAMQAIMQGIPEQQRKMGILGMLGR